MNKPAPLTPEQVKQLIDSIPAETNLTLAKHEFAKKVADARDAQWVSIITTSKARIQRLNEQFGKFGQRPAQAPMVDTLKSLLNEVQGKVTREDDLPDGLLAHIDAVLDTPFPTSGGVLHEPSYRCVPYSSVPGAKVSEPVDYYTQPTTLQFRGARVSGSHVIVMANGGNDGARKLCAQLLDLKEQGQ